MKLGKNSWHAKVNKFIYGSYYLEDVDCLCPYFWGTIIAMFAVPIWLTGYGIAKIIDTIEDQGWSLPKRRHIFVSKNQGWSLPKRRHIFVSKNQKDIIGKIIGYSFLFIIASMITIAIGLAIIEYGLAHVLFWTGVVLGVVGAFIGIVFLAVYLKERYDEWHDSNTIATQKKPNLLVEMFKAKKNKHCPLVSWVD